MVGVAQLVEHRVVIPGVAGSSPVTHPTEEEAPIDPVGASFRFPGRRLGSMRIFADVVSYGLALAAAACLAVNLGKSAVRSRKSRAKRG